MDRTERGLAARARRAYELARRAATPALGASTRIGLGMDAGLAAK